VDSNVYLCAVTVRETSIRELDRSEIETEKGVKNLVMRRILDIMEVKLQDNGCCYIIISLIIYSFRY